MQAPSTVLTTALGECDRPLPTKFSSATPLILRTADQGQQRSKACGTIKVYWAAAVRRSRRTMSPKQTGGLEITSFEKSVKSFAK